MADYVPMGMSPNPILAGREIPREYDTKLDPGMEKFFRMWVSANRVPFNPDAGYPQDYDMRGFYRALMQENPKAVSAVNVNDGLMHYPDFWKTPLHRTFSNESQWAPSSAPQWTQDNTLAQGGRVLFDERASEPFSFKALR